MTVKKCDSGIEKLHKDVKVLGDKLDIANMKIHELDVAFKNQDEKITDHLAAFSIMQVQFDNLCEEQARQKFEIDNLRTNNNRLKDIQSKVDSYSLRVEELMLKIEALHSIVEGMKQTRKEELQYRQKRAKERKEESEKRDQQRKEDREKKEKDRKSNLRWVIGIVVSLLISMGGFIWGSLTIGLKSYAKDKMDADKHLIIAVKQELKDNKTKQDSVTMRILIKIDSVGQNQKFLNMQIQELKQR